MATRLIHPDFPFTDSNGDPLASGRIYFYETGTTTPKATFSDSTLTTPSTLVTNAIVLNAEGKLGVDVWGSGEYKLDIHTAADVLTTPSYDPLLGFDLSGVTVAATIAVLTALTKASLSDTEIRKVEGHTTKGDGGGGDFQWSSSSTATVNLGTIFAANEGGTGRWLRKYTLPLTIAAFGVFTGGTAAANTTAMNSALGAVSHLSAPDETFDFTAITQGLANTQIVGTIGKTIFRWPIMGAGTEGFTQALNGLRLKGIILEGPQSGSFVSAEMGLSATGTSSASRLSGLRLVDCEIRKWGDDGISYKWFNDVKLIRTRIHDCGSSGAVFKSCDNGKVLGCDIYSMTPGTGGNTYGLLLTHTSTGYDVDPNVGTKQADNPFCADWLVSHNAFWDHLVWVALDAHGGYEITFTNNHIWSSKQGIHVGQSSGDAAAYGGENNVVANNTILAANKDGTASGIENVSMGIIVTGGTTQRHRNLKCHDNIIDGYGAANSTTTPALYAINCDNADIHHNTILSWRGTGVRFDSSSGKIDNILFGGMAAADTVARLIRFDGGTETLHLTNCNHDASDGTAATTGLYINTASHTSLYASGNDFSQVTGDRVDPLIGDFWKGTDFGNILQSVDDATPSVKTLASATGTIMLNPGSPLSITNFNDGMDGQEIIIINQTANNVTIDRTSGNFRLVGSADVILGQYDTCRLTWWVNRWWQSADTVVSG